MNLLHRLAIVAERRREHQASTRVPEAIGAVWVEFATVITLGDTERGQVSDAGDLHEFGRLDPMSAGDGALREQSSAIPGFQAVGNGRGFNVADQGFRVGCRGRAGRSKEAKVVEVIQVRVLTQRGLVAAGAAGARDPEPKNKIVVSVLKQHCFANIRRPKTHLVPD